ncbi:hypothetical protein ACWDNT_26965, partial [Streptomyces sp. NPDC000963]
DPPPPGRGPSLHHGRQVASGTPAEVLTADRLAEVFEVDAALTTDALGHPAVAYRGPLGTRTATPLP